VLVVGDTQQLSPRHYLHIIVASSGMWRKLRTHNKWHPFPEELNRRIATVIADLHFAPTEWSKANLLREGVDEKCILVTGNPVIDALNFVAKQAEPQEITVLLEKLETGKLETKRLLLVTAHRRENFGKPIENVCHAIKELASREDVEIVYPVHLNPNVQEPVNRILRGTAHVTLLPPLDYRPMVHLMKHAKLLLTDSGGLQEEAPSLGIPVLARETTRTAGEVDTGTLKLVGTETRQIVREAKRLLDDPIAHQKWQGQRILWRWARRRTHHPRAHNTSEQP
jgi:UDP-N-acetylglucosamine 2-epimerase (non-hydrolysing)